MIDSIIDNQTLPVNTEVKPAGYSHSFDVGIATECGLEAAVIYNHLHYWISHNRSKRINQHKGKTWTYDTHEAMAEIIPYLNARQVKYALKKLLDAKIIIKDCFNKDPFDKTSWYALNDESVLVNSKKSFDETKLSNRSDTAVSLRDELSNSPHDAVSSMRQNCPIDRTNLSAPLYTDTKHTYTNNTSLKVPAEPPPFVGSVDVSSSSKPKAKKEAKEFSPQVREVSTKMLGLLTEHHPVYRPPEDLTKFMNQVRMMLEDDKQKAEDILETFAWAAADNVKRDTFNGWQSVVCRNKRKGKVSNPAEIFREHFSMIHSQMNSRTDRKFAPSSNDKRALEKLNEWSKNAL
jgi:hypothetical protein